ncbi:hypothetical protein [Shewanella sp. 10N.286.48.A6]|uniref:hypothetical protein n=1 Tax=Shewanella sp. 10N.286.48.A6 TaxID=1880833 RepID=UPI000C84BA68|nr:hypothetical protein [Shewanella sp. 10N.286.48.A6]PMI03092.1 hypothetical protein BCU55_05900 [Shewanella sp. 10N.286.48.A6]
MRIQCTFNLAPELHEQHRFAIENLRAWQINEKQRNDDKDISQQRRSMFHRDIYLSGLYLNQLSAELPKLVSEQYTADSVNVGRLIKQLALFDSQIDEQDQLEAQEMSLAENQWQKMEQLFIAQLAVQQDKILAEQKSTFESMLEQQARKEAEKQAEVTSAYQAEKEDELRQSQQQTLAQFDRQNDLLQVSSDTLAAQLSAMQQQQADLIAAVELITNSAMPSAAVASSDNQIDAVEPVLEQNKVELLQAIEVNQQQLMQAFNLLKLQVGKMGDLSTQGADALSADDIEKAALSSQLQRARKIKSKGLW